MKRLALLAILCAAAIAGYDALRAPLPDPPSNVADACVIRTEQAGWYAAARTASLKWEASTPVMLAIVWRESSFIADARPPHKHLWGVIPWGRISTAYGFSQALDGTWERYKRETGNTDGRRHDFADAADFIGWYLSVSRRELGFGRTEAMKHYLAYHQGHGGYRSGRWRRKAWLLRAAKQVQDQWVLYDAQLRACDAEYAAEHSLLTSPLPPVHPRQGIDSPVPPRRPDRLAAREPDAVPASARTTETQ